MTEDLAGANPRGLHFIAELANTVQDGTEAGAAALRALLDRHGGPPFVLTESDARRMREDTARLIDILAMSDEDRAAEAINTLLDEYPARPHLVRLPGRPWSLHNKASDSADPTHWLLSTTALALGLWLSERGRCAWGQCAAPDCNHYFIDTGRRAPQRYCSPRCATRVRVASHRARQGR
ncbi:CGNR zinc finger domain-containing protein [Streptomyces sp. NPDC048295]|uniref:CGNR zinc finger domain-containing protein n=1 Tax=Streptomyces sp. NPDC048295 TaxID=3154617 RepID=UPI0034253D03